MVTYSCSGVWVSECLFSCKRKKGRNVEIKGKKIIKKVTKFVQNIFNLIKFKTIINLREKTKFNKNIYRLNWD